jgi:adenylate cyclase
MKWPSRATVVWKSGFGKASIAVRRWFHPRGARRWLGLGLLWFFVGHALHWWPMEGLQRLEGWLYDHKVRLFAPGTPDPRIVIVDIDEPSLARLGRWPWGRDKLAEVVDTLFERHGVALVGLDLILAEPDRSTGLPALEALARQPGLDQEALRRAVGTLRPRLDNDARFATSLSKHPVVLGFHLSQVEGAARNGVLPAPLVRMAEVQGRATLVARWNGWGANLESFQSVAAGAGQLNAQVDRDGTTRRAQLLAEVDGDLYGNFALNLARMLLGSQAVQLRFDDAGQVRAVEVVSAQGNLRVPVDPYGNVLLPFRGPRGMFPTVSVMDVLSSRPLPALKGKVVIVGTTAPGLLDQRSTPVGEAYAGVEAHANLLSGLLDDSLRYEPHSATALELMQLLLAGLLVIFLVPRLRAGWGATLALALWLGALAFNLVAWRVWQASLPVASLALAVPMLFGLHLFFSQFVESRSRQRLEKLFGQYVPPELVDQMSRDPANYGMTGRSEQLTVLFADVRGFTAISERLPPAELAELMNEYFSAMTDVIRGHRGTLDKYVGDALMAFWGAPVADAQHAQHAVQAALDMQAALPALNARFAARGWPALHVGIGVNSGPMVVGDLGSRHRRAYTVLGDAVNLGARLQELCALYSVPVIMGEATLAFYPDCPCREIDHVRVRGRSAEVTLYQPLAAKG